VYHLVKKLW